MRREYVLVTIFCSLCINVWSQTIDWAKIEGLWAYDYGYGVTTDNQGNVYLTGKYEENSIFSGTTVGCRGNHDIYVAKYNPQGNLVWVKTAGGVLGDYGIGIYTDNNYVYVCGEIEGYGVDVFFDDSPVMLTCTGHNDAFLAKYDLDGNLIWAKSWGAYKNDKAMAVAADANGNIFVAGFFNDTAKFEGNHYIYGQGKNDVYLAKFDASGNFQWVKHAGSAQRDEPKGIGIDAQGFVYVTGMFADNITFGQHTLSAPNGYFDMFLVKYDGDGNVVWAKRAGSDYDEVAWGLEIDNQGRIYVAGEFNAYAVFDNIAITTTGEANVFVACYDNNGNAQWVRQAGGDLIDRARGIGCDGNNVYITGQFGVSAAFGNHTVYAADSSDIFVAALNSSGDFLWATAIGGVADTLEDLGYESGCAITAHSSGAVYATGAVLDGMIVNNQEIDGYKRTDIFLVKLTNLATGISETVFSDESMIYPNPANGNFTVDVNRKDMERVDLTIYNSIGQAIDKRINVQQSKVNIDLSSYNKGIYFVEVRAGERIFREMVVLE